MWVYIYITKGAQKQYKMWVQNGMTMGTKWHGTKEYVYELDTVYLYYIWQLVYEISELSKLNKLGFHGNEYPP